MSWNRGEYRPCSDTEYGNSAGPGPSYYQAWAGIKVVDETETQVRVQYGTAIYVNSGAVSGFGGTIVRLESSDQNTTVSLGAIGWYSDSSWKDYNSNGGWVNRGETVSVYCKAYYSTYSGHYYESYASSSWTIPTLSASGAPNIKASKYESGRDESITITLSGSSSSGSAYWAGYQVTDGIGNNQYYDDSSSQQNPATITFQSVPSKIYQNNGEEKYKDKIKTGQDNFPSSLLPLKENVVYYAAREITEYYGIKLYSNWTWMAVEIKLASEVTIYDSDGKQHKGIVQFYNSDGKLCDAIITIYDENGVAQKVV